MKLKVFSLILLFILVFTTSICYGISKDPALVLYCPFDEGTGDTTKDKASGLVGKLNGVKWNPKGKIGGCVEFSGAVSIEFPKTPILDITDAITMEAWVLPNEVQGDSAIMGRRTQANVGGYCMQWTNAMIETWIHIGGWQGTRGKQTVKPKVGEWHHVASVFTGSEIIQYVDGKVDIAFNIGGKAGTVDEVFRIGQAQTSLTSMTGLIDEVAVYKRALKEDEIRADMEKGVMFAVSLQGSLTTTWAKVKR